MFKSYFKVAVRNLLRYKGFSLINIMSLSIGLIGCLVIGLFVWDEWQYDKFVPGGENIYRFYTKGAKSTGNNSTASVPPMFTAYVQQQYPEVESTTKILMYNGKMLLETNKVKAYEDKGLITDSAFFKVFQLKTLKGNPHEALAQPRSVVITDDLAKKYFGAVDPIGKDIKIDTVGYIVRAVLDNIPEHFPLLHPVFHNRIH